MNMNQERRDEIIGDKFESSEYEISYMTLTFSPP